MSLSLVDWFESERDKLCRYPNCSEHATDPSGTMCGKHVAMYAAAAATVRETGADGAEITWLPADLPGMLGMVETKGGEPREP